MLNITEIIRNYSVKMRGKIRLDGRRHVETNKGFPIIFYLTKDKKEKVILTGYHAKKEHWDNKNALPLKKHPEYLEILDYLELKKVKLKKLLDEDRYHSLNFDYAERILKGEDSNVFYNDAIKLDLHRVYRTAIENFNRYYPLYPYSLIDKKVAKEYVEKLLKEPVNGKKRSPNGVIAYLDKLTTIWNKLDKPDNPFSGVKPKTVPTKKKALNDEDLIILRDNPYKKHFGSIGGKYNFVNYFMLCFYLGGIDLVDLKKLKYNNIVNNRIEFLRSKTNVSVSNYVFPEAWNIINLYDCKPYLVPLYQFKDYDSFIPNISRYFGDMRKELKLSRKPYSKAPRHTFITRAQNLLIDERCTKSIVGHKESSVHSIYKDEFPQIIKDRAHKKIIDLSVSSYSF